jgi:hypothetical protein
MTRIMTMVIHVDPPMVMKWKMVVAKTGEPMSSGSKRRRRGLKPKGQKVLIGSLKPPILKGKTLADWEA